MSKLRYDLKLGAKRHCRLAASTSHPEADSGYREFFHPAGYDNLGESIVVAQACQNDGPDRQSGYRVTREPLQRIASQSDEIPQADRCQQAICSVCRTDDAQVLKIGNERR